MGSSTALQSWALIRRYLIILTRSPISSFLRCIVWRSLLIGCLIYMLVSISEDIDYLKQLQLENYLPIFISLVTGIDVWSFSEYLIADRSIGMKSLMTMMGLKKISYYIGNFISFSIFVFPYVLGLAITSIIYIFLESQTNIIAILLVYLLYFIHISGLTFVFASIITSSSYSTFVLIVLLIQWIGFHRLIILILDKTSESFWPVTLFFAGISPFESFNIFCNSYTHCKHDCQIGMSKEESQVYQPVYLTLVTMTIWSVLSFLFALWFEDVCPWQTDTAREDLLFCCKSQISSYKRFNEQLLVEEPIDNQQNNRYFEQIVNQTRGIGIRIRNIFKTFEQTVAVNDLSFDIYQGETTLLLGHNGAGKTTLMNIILRKLKPNKGFIFINDSETNGIGVCPQNSILDDNLSVQQHLDLFADIKTNFTIKSERNNHILKTIQDVSLNNESAKLPQELSGGMKRKLSLAMAFVGKSKVLILDEPSSGLDPDSRMFVWNAIRRYRKDRTVLLSTQHMEEADYLGDRIAIMAQGKIVCCGSSIFLNNVLGNSYKLRVECDKQKEGVVLGFVKKYFNSAKLLNSSLCPDSIIELTIELIVNDKKSSDLMESKLIEMLEFIENNSKNLHGIKSYGLKSSSIEDVMLNIGKIKFDDRKTIRNDRNTNKNINNETRLNLTPNVNENIEILSKAPRIPQQSSSQLTILKALLLKQLQTYKTDFLYLSLYRILVPLVSIYIISLKFKSKNMLILDGTTSLEPILVMHLIYYPTLERVSKFKTMQLTSFANLNTYWWSQFIADSATIILFVLLYDLFFLYEFDGIYVESQGLVISILTISMLLFGISSCLFAYILSNIFNDVKTAIGQLVLILLSDTFVDYIIQIIGLTIKRDLSLLKNIFGKIFLVIFPTNALPFIRNGLISNCYIKQSLIDRPCTDISKDEISPVVLGMSVLLGQVIVYYLILTLMEWMNFDLAYYFRWKNITYCCRNGTSQIQQNIELDIDVANESSKASQLINFDNNPRRENFSLIASNLSKSYIYDTKVVNQLSFTVKKGECFGLLGVNGAGKSTTFSMLSAEFKPDTGKIWINDSYNPSIYRDTIGYDPQSNPEISLTCMEVLYLMARLRRIDESAIPMVVKSVLELLQMEEHSTKIASQLSGGTKRKLSLGMTLIGNPSLALLDEPTAGVDPMARVDIWALLRSLRMFNNISIIISSHAMEECEAVCDRIAIMAKGKLRCIGTFLQLRSKFSRGSRLKIQFCKIAGAELNPNKNSSVIKEIEQRLMAKFGNIIELADTNLNSATFNINDNEIKRSTLLKIMREFRKKQPNLSYVINDKSLEDIFITIAREEMDKREGTTRV